MGFELTQSAVFYILIMIVVIFIGLSIVAKGNPIALFKQTQFEGVFEPGKVVPKSQIDPYVKLACGDPSRVIIDGAGFVYKGRPGDKAGSVNFFMVLDYGGLLFAGNKIADGYQTNEIGLISCSAGPSDAMSDCPPVKIGFDLVKLGPFDESRNQTFHFTIWKANQALEDSAREDKMTLDKLLDTYSYYYVSSFDVTKDAGDECRQYKCAGQEKDVCIDTSGCYWTENWMTTIWKDTCNACPTSTECGKYDKTQCTQCPFPQANCNPGTLWGCEV